LQAQAFHQPFDRAAGDPNTFAVQLMPDPLNLRHQGVIPLGTAHSIAAACVGKRAWRRYPDGAIGSTLQIGSTPWVPRCWSMNPS